MRVNAIESTLLAKEVAMTKLVEQTSIKSSTSGVWRHRQKRLSCMRTIDGSMRELHLQLRYESTRYTGCPLILPPKNREYVNQRVDTNQTMS